MDFFHLLILTDRDTIRESLEDSSKKIKRISLLSYLTVYSQVNN